MLLFLGIVVIGLLFLIGSWTLILPTVKDRRRAEQALQVRAHGLLLERYPQRAAIALAKDEFVLMLGAVPGYVCTELCRLDRILPDTEAGVTPSVEKARWELIDLPSISKEVEEARQQISALIDELNKLEVPLYVRMISCRKGGGVLAVCKGMSSSFDESDLKGVAILMARLASTLNSQRTNWKLEKTVDD